MVLMDRANEKDRNNPVLRKEISDSLKAEQVLAAQAMVRLDALIADLTADYLVHRMGNGVFWNRMMGPLRVARSEAAQLASLITDLEPESTYVGNMAAFVNPTTYDNGEDY